MILMQMQSAALRLHDMGEACFLIAFFCAAAVIIAGGVLWAHRKDRKDARRAAKELEQYFAPPARDACPILCPCCGATDIPDKTGRCPYCGSIVPDNKEVSSRGFHE